MGRNWLYSTFVLLTAAGQATAAGPRSYYEAREKQRVTVSAPAAETFETEQAFEGDPAVYEVDDGEEYVADDSGQLMSYEEAFGGAEQPLFEDIGGPPPMHYGNSGCGDQCDCSACCAPRPWYGRAEYLQYWVRGMHLPPLVTTSPPGTPAQDAGILPDASILIGGTRVDADRRTGGRYTIGWWCDDCLSSSFEGTFLQFENTGTVQQLASDGSVILAQPFIDVTAGLPGTPSASPIALPNVLAGAVSVVTTSRILGSEVNYRHAMQNDCECRIDCIAGYRFFRLDESLRVGTVTQDLTGQFPVDTRFVVADSFSTQNQFHGGQVGLQMERRINRWSWDVLGKLAIGGMPQKVYIRGATVVTDPNNGNTVIPGGGFYALGSNIGDFQRTKFSLLPEFGANLHYCFTPNCRLTAGYSILFVTNVVRAGDQVDTRIDTNQLPPPVATGDFPAVTFRDTTLWLQGVNLGLECRF